MKKLVAALLVASGLGGASPSALAATFLFKGTMGIESMTAGCGILPYLEQGSLFKAVYKPAGLGTNGSSTALVIQRDVPVSGFMDVLLSSFLIEPGNLGEDFQDANAAQATAHESLSLNFEEFIARMRLLQQSPATLTEATKLVAMRLQIRKFANVAQCTMTLRAVLSAQ